MSECRAHIDDIPHRIAEYIDDMTQGPGARATIEEVNCKLAQYRLELSRLASATAVEKLAELLDAVVHEDWASISVSDVQTALDELGLKLVPKD